MIGQLLRQHHCFASRTGVPHCSGLNSRRMQNEVRLAHSHLVFVSNKYDAVFMHHMLTVYLTFRDPKLHTDDNKYNACCNIGRGCRRRSYGTF